MKREIFCSKKLTRLLTESGQSYPTGLVNERVCTISYLDSNGKATSVLPTYYLKDVGISDTLYEVGSLIYV